MPRPRRSRDNHLLLLDGTAALLITAAYVGFSRMAGSETQPAYTGPVWAGVAVAAAVGLPVAVRRVRPVAAAVTALGGAACASLLDLTREPYTAVALTLYLVALAEPRRRSVPVLVAALAVTAGAVLTGEAVVTPAESWSGAVGIAATVWLFAGGGWSAGYVVRTRRARAAERAERRTERAVIEERLRIARELHDIVSHSLSLIAVRAGVAGHVAGARPEEAIGALKDIEDTSRAAMTEMRRALGVLRATPEEPGAGRSAALDPARAPAPALAPAPGLDGLPELAARARLAGLVVDLVVDVPEPAGLPAGLSLAVHRIVQEGLTNAVRHAGPTRCRVAVEADHREVRVEVADDGRAADGGPGARTSAPAGTGRGAAAAALRRSRRPRSGGHGLIGMGERVAMYGGTFSAGPRPGGGYVLAARIPREGRGADDRTRTAPADIR